MRARLKSEEGLSLVELLTTMVLMGLLIPGLALMLTTTIRWTSGSQEEATIHTEARAGIDRMSAEIRQVYSGDTTWPISSITPTSGSYFTFLTPDRTRPAADGSDPTFTRWLPLAFSPQLLRLMKWEADGTGGAMQQKTAVLTLRTLFDGCVPENLLPVLRRIRFGSTSEGAGTVEHGRRSTGSSIESSPGSSMRHAGASSSVVNCWPRPASRPTSNVGTTHAM